MLLTVRVLSEAKPSNISPSRFRQVSSIKIPWFGRRYGEETGFGQVFYFHFFVSPLVEVKSFPLKPKGQSGSLCHPLPAPAGTSPNSTSSPKRGWRVLWTPREQGCWARWPLKTHILAEQFPYSSSWAISTWFSQCPGCTGGSEECHLLNNPKPCVSTEQMDSRNEITHCKLINIASKCLKDNKFRRSYLEEKQEVRDKAQAL